VPRAERKVIVWLPQARRNRQEQLEYIAERNPTAAIRVGDAVQRTITRLADFPESARPGRILGTREAYVPGTPLIVIYRLELEAIVILRVLHSRQKWPPA
jgi:toxin ParE1/3/4